MSLDGLIPLPPEGTGPQGPWITVEDPRRRLDVERQRWERRSAQWRAMELAQAVFGEEETLVELASYPSRNGFHGLLHVRVPFDDLESHRAREARFTELVDRDEILSRLPMVFVFDPIPLPSP